ncbi:histidine phosphatase family protein [Metabacillus sp. KIGAM252]|uniref:phosphoglycerate mutase (2,3-diphosphoglycerate-dependent) n=1 Tax=Metabacillus flavus TaxID=2823519 RepID=A0ABS5LD91_9BACI|nr:histidine phosphatase family protein [Metabacillus flavus]MBS2968710.1 histidine phosphatase family protein [Metabacillus flavus]
MFMDGFVAVTLLRHGLTEKNSRHAYIGWTDDSLSEEGKSSLAAVSLPKPDALFTSGMLRTNETAHLLFPGLKKTEILDLKEYHFGSWEGRTYAELKDDREYQHWLENMENHAPPGGESLQVFKKRVMNGWGKVRNSLLNDEADTAAIVSHGGPLRQLLTLLSGDGRAFWEWTVSPGTGYELIWTKDSFRRGEPCASLRAVPSTARLNG